MAMTRESFGERTVWSTRADWVVVPLGLFAILYFSSLVRYGFDWGDMGSYAELVMDLHSGAPFGSAVGYGPLWYMFGMGVFHFDGVSYAALLTMFALFLSTVTIALYYVAKAVTGRTWLAVLVALLFVGVPPTLASTLRSICFVINALPVVVLARSDTKRHGVWFSIWGAAVAVTFLIRPDFGYFFLMMLLACVVDVGFETDVGFRDGCRRTLRFLILGVVAMTAVALPVLVYVWWHRGLGAVIADELSYPQRILYFLQHSHVAEVVGRQQSTNEYLTLPPPSNILSFDPAVSVFPILVYSSALVIVLDALWVAAKIAIRPFLWRRHRIDLVVLALVGSQFPIFAFFRPDWSHFINFMHGYLLVMALIAARCIARLSEPTAAKPAPVAIAYGVPLAIIAAQTVAFLAFGLFQPESGAISLMSGRNELFEAAPGMALKVNPAEKRLYSTINKIITQNSSPGERIVCVSYCAGFAFMAGRRLLFPEHYVDNATPKRTPGWIDHAIEATRAARTPVIIVQDWGPNGTPDSRFDHWASAYMDFLRINYKTAIALPGNTIYLKNPIVRDETPLPAIVDYGPKGTVLGQGFNVQPDGRSALWMKVGDIPETARIEFDGTPLETTAAPGVLTTAVPPALLKTAGHHEIVVTDTATGRRTPGVPFEISAK